VFTGLYEAAGAIGRAERTATVPGLGATGLGAPESNYGTLFWPPDEGGAQRTSL
jgi:hypothetical protein